MDTETLKKANEINAAIESSRKRIEALQRVVDNSSVSLTVYGKGSTPFLNTTHPADKELFDMFYSVVLGRRKRELEELEEKLARL